MYSTFCDDLLNWTYCIVDFSKPLPARKISKNFDSWLESNGAQFEGLKLAELSDYGCGLVATKDIESGEMILKIPRKLMMTVEDAESSHLSMYKLTLAVPIFKLQLFSSTGTPSHQL